MRLNIQAGPDHGFRVGQCLDVRNRPHPQPVGLFDGRLVTLLRQVERTLLAWYLVSAPVFQPELDELDPLRVQLTHGQSGLQRLEDRIRRAASRVAGTFPGQPSPDREVTGAGERILLRLDTQIDERRRVIGVPRIEQRRVVVAQAVRQRVPGVGEALEMVDDVLAREELLRPRCWRPCPRIRCGCADRPAPA